ncbi:MAG: HAMP domain-containing histidine kinase, partial [Clostridiaceae bacterium]|nr:HAMP domain-containing histidine kinase [Clostridiaceae bacterium]
RKLADKAQQIATDPSRTVLLGDRSSGEGDLAVLRHAVIHLAEKASGQLKTLEQDKKYLQNFLSDISHQIKTPLASLQLYFDLMLQNKEMPEEKRQQFIEQGQVQIRRIDWLIQGLLKMARIDAGSVKMRMVPMDIAETAAQAVSPFSEQLQQRQINLQNKIPSGTIWPHDPEWLAEALSNLIKNAIEHTPTGGSIELNANKTALSLQLQISDTGPGVLPEQANKIFERFYRQESASRPDSVGIGLSLARSIFEQNGADLIAGSRPGGGAVFTASFLKKA